MGYGTLTGADSYFTARGNATWFSGIAQHRTQALLRAADYIKYTYVKRFQAGFTDTVAEVELATYEAAVIELTTPGFFSKTYTEADRKVLIEVEGVKWQVTGSSKDSRSMVPVSTKIEMMLWPYVARTYGAVVV